ncbi:hypothetical protein BDN72DRAFT_96107 [Pluteus cervinus]|uniref:Uncharacterized protein n=1 Tax=Pluteus cervinus TaxID=181527 RepID=A0ACD3APC5_9AGAR|nr:hypothetical protein BDN72DRAFT_96107 [Pluteus cervinus]
MLLITLLLGLCLSMHRGLLICYFLAYLALALPNFCPELKCTLPAVARERI